MWVFERVAPTEPNSYLKVNLLSPKIQLPIKIFLKKPESILIHLSDTLPPQPSDKNITAPDGVIPTKYLAVLLCL